MTTVQTRGRLHFRRLGVLAVSGGVSFVAVVELTDLTQSHDWPDFRRLNRARLGRVFSQRQVRSESMIVDKIGNEGSACTKFFCWRENRHRRTTVLLNARRGWNSTTRQIRRCRDRMIFGNGPLRASEEPHSSTAPNPLVEAYFLPWSVSRSSDAPNCLLTDAQDGLLVGVMAGSPFGESFRVPDNILEIE